MPSQGVIFAVRVCSMFFRYSLNPLMDDLQKRSGLIKTWTNTTRKGFERISRLAI